MAIEGMSDWCDDQTIRLAEYFGKNRTVKALHVAGTDTDVYAVTPRKGGQPYVAQVYDGFTRVDQDIDHPRLVREYAADMRAWQGITQREPNPLQQQVARGIQPWRIEYEVVAKDRYMEIDGTPCLLTKRYFEDKDMRGLRDEAAGKKWNGSVATYDEIEERTREWFAYMNRLTGCAYDFAPMNARLVWDKERRVVRVLVTDLANSLYLEMNRKYNFDKTKLAKPSPTPERGNH